MGTISVVTPDSASAGESHRIRGSLSQSPDERVLPEWMNAAQGTASYRRVTQIIEAMRQIEESTRKAVAAGAYRHVFKAGAPRKYPEAKLKMQREANPFFARLERTLKCYTFRVAATKILSTQSGGWLPTLRCRPQKNDFGLELEHGKYFRAVPGETVLSRATYRMLEGDAVLAVLRLAERGMLSRIRLCQKCSERWLFAAHSNYRFCSAECRESYFTSTEEYREKKKTQMKQYRERLAQHRYHS